MIMGTGFAPFRGGPLRYADSLGLAEVVKAMQQLADTGLTQFQPCALIQKLSSNGKRFYPSSAS
jgi:3-hydroxyacyl-CoA dehydrogenase/enoyl-CoA hydratase/3-hydroxybutyryl-CoA epimerase